MLRSFKHFEGEDTTARVFTKEELIMLIPRLGSYPTSCLFPVSSHVVRLILVGSLMTSVKASASSNHSLLMMAERFVMSLKCLAYSPKQEIGVSDSSCAFGLSTLW
jgi:hypothetical protein